MQFQADVLGVDCVRPTVLETTALGSAFLAGLAVGMWQSTDAITSAWAKDQQFSPSMNPDQRQVHLRAWSTAVAKS
jgi:glycerol kinase